MPQERDVDNKILCFTYVELEKNVTSYEIFEKFSYVRVLLIDGGAVKKNTWPQYEKNHIQQPGTTFSNFSDKVAVPRGHENSCRFATLQ